MHRLLLTPDVVVGAVHHVCGVDEVVAGAFHTQLNFIVTQDNFASAVKDDIYVPAEMLPVVNDLPSAYLVSMPMGVKSSLCLV